MLYAAEASGGKTVFDQRSACQLLIRRRVG